MNPPWLTVRLHHDAGSNPGWEYRFWTDADNRALIKEKFPESLAMFDGYTSAILRADAIRYCLDLCPGALKFPDRFHKMIFSL
jgi:mannosyltransferase OCH1-like enzyme